MNNHREQFTIGTKYPINALNPCLSIKEDFRRGTYYVKHMHQVGTGTKMFMVFKDNPAPDRNWRGNQFLHVSFGNDTLPECIDWISKRRCFKEVT